MGPNVLDSDDIITRYTGDGYCFPLEAMSVEQAAHYRGSLEREEQRPFRSPQEKSVFYGAPHYVLPFMNEITRLPNVIEAVKAVLGPNLLVWEASLFIKEATTPGFVSWHQDLTYCGLSDYSEVTAWVALSPATPHSGCMRFSPGSHRGEIVDHRDTFNEQNMLSRGQEIAVEVEEADAVDVVLNPGEFSLHHGHIFHSSKANGSQDRRIGFAIRYITPRMKQVSGQKPFAQLVAGEDPMGNFLALTPPTAIMQQQDLENAWRTMRIQEPVFYEGLAESDRPAT